MHQYAHNRMIHQTVELGYLGLSAYVGLLAVFFGSAAILFSSKATISPSFRIVLAALMAAMGGRLVEQMFGIAHIGDLTLFWVLLAILVALPHAAGARTPDLANDRLDPRIPGLTLLNWRAPLAVLLLIAMATMVWLKNVNYVLADVSAASARQHAVKDFAKALSLSERAIQLAPDVPEYYWQRGEMLTALRGQTDEVELQADLAEEVNLDYWRGSQANPLSHLGRLKLAKATLALARMGYEGKDHEAVLRYQELIGMAPGYKELHGLLGIANAQLHENGG